MYVTGRIKVRWFVCVDVRGWKLGSPLLSSFPQRSSRSKHRSQPTAIWLDASERAHRVDLRLLPMCVFARLRVCVCARELILAPFSSGIIGGLHKDFQSPDES